MNVCTFLLTCLYMTCRKCLTRIVFHPPKVTPLTNPVKITIHTSRNCYTVSSEDGKTATKAEWQYNLNLTNFTALAHAFRFTCFNFAAITWWECGGAFHCVFVVNYKTGPTTEPLAWVPRQCLNYYYCYYYYKSCLTSFDCSKFIQILFLFNHNGLSRPIMT